MVRKIPSLWKLEDTSKRSSFWSYLLFLAFISLFLVPFDTILSYNYDRIFDTICTLLFFLLIVAGLKECRALDKIAQLALGGLKTTVSLCLVLIFLPFFSAMLFSNDVSLLTFVPLTIAILALADMKKLIAPVVILQTVAANIGSSLTPFGNPHNLYIFNLKDFYGFSIMDYELALIPMVIVGTLLILLMISLLPRNPLDVELKDVELQCKPKLIVIIVLFILAIITVLDVIPPYITLIILVAAFLIMMPKIFLKVDYSILFIFFFLFIFANSISSVEGIHSFITDMMEWDPFLTTVMVSQFTSNVPSTILLQPFTDVWAAILVGADVGGFGTPIASMASVITLRLYLREEDSDVRQFLKYFFLIELAMLVVLIPTYYIFS